MSDLFTSDIEKQAEQVAQAWDCSPNDAVIEGLSLFEAKKKHEALRAEIQQRLDSNKESIPAEQVFKEIRDRAEKRKQ